MVTYVQFVHCDNFVTLILDGGMINSCSGSNIINLAFQRDRSSTNLVLPRDNSSTSISTMRKDMSNGSIGSIDTPADVQQQSTAEVPRTRAQTLLFGSAALAHAHRSSPSVASGRKGVPGSAGGGGGSGDHDAYDACVFALEGGAFRMQRHVAAHMHRLVMPANHKPRCRRR